MYNKFTSITVIFIICFTLFSSTQAQIGPSFLDNGNVVDFLAENNPAGANEVTIDLYRVVLVSEIWHESLCLYRQGVSCRFFDHTTLRRPQSEYTPRNLNTAILYGIHQMRRIMNTNQDPAEADGLLLLFGLDPSNESTTLDNPVGIGRRAAEVVLADRLNDGLNRIGNDPNSLFLGKNYSDTTGYEPVNGPRELKYPNRWQPDTLFDEETFFYRVQSYITPQLANVQMYGLGSESVYRRDLRHLYRHPIQHPFNKAFFDQINQVLNVTAELTDYQKMIFELWDDKLFGPSLLTRHVSNNIVAANSDLQTQIVKLADINMLANQALFDSFISTWAAKTQYDSVRPFSAIRHFYADQNVPMRDRSTGGLKMVKGRYWKSWGYTDGHPEYPSGTACFCEALGQTVRLFQGSDEFPVPFTVTRPTGSSVREPGITPKQDLTITIHSVTDLVNECAASRLWGGVHFSPSIEETDVCGEFGDRAFARWIQLFN